MPRRWHHVLKKLTLLRGNGGKQARSPGRARSKPLKPFAQGRPGVLGEPVVTNSRVFYFYTRGCGCAGAPAFPAPSDGCERSKLGQIVSRGRALMPFILRYSGRREAAIRNPWRRRALGGMIP